MKTLNQTLKEFDKEFNYLGNYNIDELDNLEQNAKKYLALKDFISAEIKTSLESVVPIGKCCGGDLMMNEDVEKCRGWNKCREQLLKNIENYLKN